MRSLSGDGEWHHDVAAPDRKDLSQAPPIGGVEQEPSFQLHRFRLDDDRGGRCSRRGDRFATLTLGDFVNVVGEPGGIQAFVQGRWTEAVLYCAEVLKSAEG